MGNDGVVSPARSGTRQEIVIAWLGAGDFHGLVGVRRISFVLIIYRGRWRAELDIQIIGVEAAVVVQDDEQMLSGSNVDFVGVLGPRS